MRDPFKGYDAWKTSGPPEDDAFEDYVDRYGDEAVDAILAVLHESGMPTRLMGEQRTERFNQAVRDAIETNLEWSEIMRWGVEVGNIPEFADFSDIGDE